MKLSYYTLKQACEKLQLSEKTIRVGIKEGKIPRAEFTKKILIPASFFKDADGR